MIARADRYTFEQPPENLNGYDPTRGAGDMIWDAHEAARAVNFFGDCLVLTSGKTAGQPFRLERWQADFVATLYGWKRPDKDRTRRYREAFFAVPRKNGKTETGAGLALFGLMCDREQAAQVYSAAKNRDQAALVYEPASRMAERSPMLSGRLKCIDSKKRIVHYGSSSYYQAVSADAGSAHGKSPHLVIFDEAHTQPNAKLYEGLKTGMGFRRQPLFVNTTTAGTDRHSLCYQVWSYARQVRDGKVDDLTFLPMLYEIGEGEDWQDRDAWRRCNPNLDVTVTMEFLEDEYRRACSSPLYENSFRNLYLNEWTQQAVRWFSMSSWNACAAPQPDLTGRECWIGVDLAATTDITAVVAAFPMDDGTIYIVPHFWIPAEAISARSHRDKVPYEQWAKAGLVTATDGGATDYDSVRAWIEKFAESHWVQQIRMDPWNAQQVATQLQQAGLPVEAMRQGYASISGPSKEFERAIVNRTLRHASNPVLDWMAGNVAIESDAAGNIKPSKAKSTERIDGIVAAVMSIAGLVTRAETQQSYYANNPLEMA